MVERGELKLKEFNFKIVRVRKEGDMAKIELPEEDIARFLDDAVRQDIVSYFKDIGFTYITLDLEGFQSGKLNRRVA